MKSIRNSQLKRLKSILKLNEWRVLPKKRLIQLNFEIILDFSYLHMQFMCIILFFIFLEIQVYIPFFIFISLRISFHLLIWPFACQMKISEHFIVFDNFFIIIPTSSEAPYQMLHSFLPSSLVVEFPLLLIALYKVRIIVFRHCQLWH